MSITKLKSGSFRVEVYCPKEFRQLLEVNGERFRECRPTKKEAKELEKYFESQITLAKCGKIKEKKNSDILFKDFYVNNWLPEYKKGRTGKSTKIPLDTTVLQTENVFKNKILPIFSDYRIQELNDNKVLVIEKLNELSEVYSNIKTVKCYLNQIFDLAEFLEIIEVNKIEKSLRRVSDVKKQKLRQQKKDAGEALTAKELIEWLNCIEADYTTGKFALMDYLLFHLTLRTGIRKSEAYGFQWKHIDFSSKTLLLVQSLDKFGKPKTTKGNKRSKIQIPALLVGLLKQWKIQQEAELAKIGISVNEEQFVFTFTNKRGEMNARLHTDYLNYRLNTFQRRYEHLAKLNPHKLRHTYATLAREGGANIDDIQNALTHSDKATTSIYVNTENIVNLSTYRSFEDRLENERKSM